MRRKEKVLRAALPNAGIEMAYRAALVCSLERMHNSLCYWLTATFKANEPLIAQDAGLPATELKKKLKKLGRQWTRQWNQAAPKMAKHFAKAISKRSDDSLRRILKEAGIAVEFKLTKEQKDILISTVQQNVGLIKSIPQQYLTQVEGMVMRSVQTGHDLAQLTKNLQKAFGVTKRRAQLIAKDQNNKATSALLRARHIELELFDHKWMHSGAGKKPRPTHVKMHNKMFDIRKGMWDTAVKQWIQPGFLINCRCASRPVIKGFE